MGWSYALAALVLCALVPGGECVPQEAIGSPALRGDAAPSRFGHGRVAGEYVRTGEAVDVILTAPAALAWDVATGQVIYEKAINERRSVASLNKLVTALVVRERASPEAVVTIPAAVKRGQRGGANLNLHPGEHATVASLLKAAVIASANDAAIALAQAVAEDETAYVAMANAQLERWGVPDMRVANATGLSGGDQYATAEAIRSLIAKAFVDPLLRDALGQAGGELLTQEGTRVRYRSTNKLNGTYIDTVIAKTGFTREAGENLAMIARLKSGRLIGATILGSRDRFQDMKVLLEWIEHTYTWSAPAR